ncbi:hypothetical protein [Vibrio sp. HN007]|uniref:hypothetical protein n=1 Tax=Vibrio iocasae TaxID=3098914 RepID=UPI0035D42263
MLSQELFLSSGFYCEKSIELVQRLPIPDCFDDKPIDNNVVNVDLPDWYSCPGGVSYIPVPKCMIPEGKDIVWNNVDWFTTAYLMSTNTMERLYENEVGSIHSFSHKLNVKLDCSYAWVNRIFLFLRKWYCHLYLVNEDDVFPKLPKPKIYLTHDVDYVRKTLPLTIKSSAFNIFNSIRFLKRLDILGFFKTISSLIKGIFDKPDYWQFESILTLEEKYNVTSQWNFYSKTKYNNKLSLWLFDPSYDINSNKISNIIKKLILKGHSVGLHQSYGSWNDKQRMQEEKDTLEYIAKSQIVTCRQHWLRFSFKDTWHTQERCGFTLDTTLGFNDKPGFRNFTAFKFPAFIDVENRFSASLKCLPLILMDSHLYDYEQLTQEQRYSLIDHYLDELESVCGQASVVWHQRVFHKNYGWCESYEYLLRQATIRGML